MLDCCRTIDSVKTILIATSDKCYENSDKSKDYFENDKLNGDDPYSASKAAKKYYSMPIINLILEIKKLELLQFVQEM